MSERKKDSSFIEFWSSLRSLEQHKELNAARRRASEPSGFYRRNSHRTRSREELQVVRSYN